ncbi:MAG: hypothetical protein ACXAEU_17900 [Candidatus Hodarchaeales archaeon]
MAVDLSFIIYNTIWIVPIIYPYLLILIINRFRLPRGNAAKALLLSMIGIFILVVADNAYAILILSYYGGEFSPSSDLITGIFIYSSITEFLVLLALVLSMIVVKLLKPHASTVKILEYTKQYPIADYLEGKDSRWVMEYVDSKDGHWILSIIFSWISLLFLLNKPTNIAYVQKFLAFWIDTFTVLIIILFIGASLWISLVLGTILLNRVDMQVKDYSYLVQRYIIYLFAIFIGLGIITFFLHDFFGLGISIISGKELYFPLTFAGILVIVLGAILISPILLTSTGLAKAAGIIPRKTKSIIGSGYYMTRLIAIIVMILFIGLPLLAVPVTTSVPSLEGSRTALENQIYFADKPIDEYPVNLTSLRVVSRNLAKDISLSRLPAPPKSFALNVMPEHEVIGMINNRPAWVIPMRYESFFNIETNILAGYISIYLDDPIPEHINIVFEEMIVGPGLTGYRDIHWLVTQVKPRSLVGEISFMDPYVDGEPAWMVVLDKYNAWGVRTADDIMVVHKDGNYELIESAEAPSKGFPELISERAFEDIATKAGIYLRSGLFDPTAKGLVTIPPSPDRVINLIDESEYYSFPHHFLIGENKSWFGRLYYQEVTTGDRESVVIWTVINGTITFYDLREYSRGGARGVNTPDKVVSDLQVEISKSFQDVGNYYIQQPTLYKTIIDNNTILVWVSLLIQSKQGADELIGAAFIDAANTRIVGVKSRAVGMSAEVFKDRLQESIEQTYRSFGVDEQAGESQTITIQNGTILAKEWTGFDSDSRKTYVLSILDQSTLESYLMVVKWSEAGTGADYYLAAAANVGEYYYFKARFDKDEQVFVMINCQYAG